MSNRWQLVLEEPGQLRKLIEKQSRPAANSARKSAPAGALRTATERALAAIFAQALGIEQVGRDDDFFAMGGHSLLATRVIAQVRASLKLQAPLEWILEAPTVARLAERIDRALAEKTVASAELEQLPQAVLAPEDAQEPFELTDIQQAYWVGRSKIFELGNISTHIYLEFEKHDLNAARLEAAWQKLILRHDMLRGVMGGDGLQRVLKEVPAYSFATADLTQLDLKAAQARAEETREQMSHQEFDATRWPLFDIRLSRLPGGAVRTHFSVDLLMLDAGSLGILFNEWQQSYEQPEKTLKPLELRFRDYVLAAAQVRKTQLHKRSQDYWWGRVPTLAAAPQLPFAKSTRSIKKPRFVRRNQQLDSDQWSRLKKRAAEAEVTPSALLAALFAEVLASWSRSSRFTVNVTLFNRLPLHPQSDFVIGDFTSLALLEMEGGPGDDLKARAKQVQRRLWTDLDHRYVSGVEVLRELGRRTESVVLMPVVFTSTLGLKVPMNGESALLGREVYGLTQTPQVALDHLIFENDQGGLKYCWDVIEELFPAGMIDEMFEAYRRRLGQLCEGEWAGPPTLVPQKQLDTYKQWNATSAPPPGGLLHSRLLERARTDPGSIAVISSNRTLTYAQLASEARRLGRRLRESGVKPNQLVAVVMERGWEQTVAVIGILESGAAYVPIDAELPAERRLYLLKACQVSVILTQRRIEELGPWPEGVERICIEPNILQTVSDSPLAPVQQATDLAYVIFTSGSTGAPKGVMIEHGPAVNTVEDVTARHRINAQDKVLSLSSLSFDLSVYDVFGILGAGGTVVLVSPGDARDPARWLELIRKHRVTVWNSVPALMQMLLNHPALGDGSALATLRLALWSGDWVPVNLADRLRALVKNIRTISMGGATEASIWSIDYPIETVEPGWSSIPYGRPMRNQTWHVLDERLEPRPLWVPGELYIGGIGLARGYWRDEARTLERFIRHPKTGERLYRTGDWGRFLGSGEIEFLGREDGQVKIRGFRVELGEIDSVLAALPEVREGLCATYADASKQKSLAAYLVLKEGAQLDEATVRARIAARLPEYMVPSQVIFLEALPLSSNGKIDRKALPSPIARAASAVHVAPRNEPEKKMAAVWRELLQKEEIGVTDNFFALGGNSLIAVMIVARAPAELGLEIPLSSFLQHPTIESLLASVEPASPSPDATAAKRARHLITLTPGDSRPPLIFVSGMGGYAFVFAGLARLLGPSQPLYVLNAIGVEDEAEGPDLSIEEMAKIYEEQIVAACPQGPVILGGYSFGMIVAFEVARRMQAAGRPIPLLISFDGFAPDFPKMMPLPKRALAHVKAFFSRDGEGGRHYLRERFKGIKSRFYNLLGRSEDAVSAIPFAGPAMDRRLRKVAAALWQAGLRYHPNDQAESDLLLIKTSISERWVGNYMDDPLYGWRESLRGTIDVFTVPGVHLTLFEEANQPLITDAISRAIERSVADRARKTTT